jgi:hypothetical protein
MSGKLLVCRQAAEDNASPRTLGTSFPQWILDSEVQLNGDTALETKDTLLEFPEHKHTSGNEPLLFGTPQHTHRRPDGVW